MRFSSGIAIALAAALLAGTGLTLRGGEENVARLRVITLDHAYDLALATDQSIRRAYWEIRKANLEPWSALTRLGPSLTGGASLARSRRTISSNGTTSVFDQPAIDGSFGGSTSVVSTTRRTRSDTGALDLTFQQTVFDLTALPAYRLGKLTAQAARLTYQSTMRQVLFGVSQAYYEVLKQQRISVVSRETLRLAQEQLDLAQKRADVGEVTRSDVLRAQVTLESDRRTLIETENTLVSKRNILANILNLGDHATYAVTEPPPYQSALPPFDTLLARAMGEREDLRVQAIAIGQDIQLRNGVMAEYAPKVVAQMSGDRNSISGTSDSQSHSWDATLSVEIPFLTGGQREIDLRRAGYQIEQTRLDYEIFAKNVQQEVKDAWLQVRTLAETLKAVKVQVEAAQQAYEDIRNQYRAGTATSVDVLSALNDLNIARRDSTTQNYDYQIALRNLEQVTGVFQNERVSRVKFR